MSMPDEIELPRAEDFCRNVYNTGSGKCCFEGWRMSLFPNMTEAERLKFRDLARVEARKLKLNAGRGTFYGILSTNDSRLNTYGQLAKWFEQTVKKFGYDIS